MNSNEQQQLKLNSQLLMPLNTLNNFYEQILQRNLIMLNQQNNMFANNSASSQQTLLEYQLRYRTLMNTVTTQNYSNLPKTNFEVHQHQNIENSNSRTSVSDTHEAKVSVVESNKNEISIKQELPKPTHSYIGLIALAILSTPEKKIVLSDIYQWILDNYIYFRNRGPGWRNSIRHNLSLNDCFIKCGRSVNGKGHYWTIHPANLDDFSRGDFRRRRAQRRVRKSLGLTVPEEDEDDDDEYEDAAGEDGDHYEEELAASSASSSSPKIFDNNNNNIKRRNYPINSENKSTSNAKR